MYNSSMDNHESLSVFLHEEGYLDSDIDEAVAAYFSNGIEAAVQTYAWADDDEHDYAEELRSVIIEWEKLNGISKGYPEMRLLIK